MLDVSSFTEQATRAQSLPYFHGLAGTRAASLSLQGGWRCVACQMIAFLVIFLWLHFHDHGGYFLCRLDQATPAPGHAGSLVGQSLPVSSGCQKCHVDNVPICEHC